MKVMDDVLPTTLAENLYTTLTWDFKWHFLSNTTGRGYEDHMDGRYPSMVNTVFDSHANVLDKDDFYRLESTVWILSDALGLDKENLARIRLGLYLPINHGAEHHTPHRDQQYPHTVVIYYVCGDDGDTFFFDKKGKNVVERVSPKKNRLVVFDGSTLHASSNPTKGHRISMNLNYRKK